MENPTVTTVNVFIQEEEFVNFAAVDIMNLDHFSEEGLNKILDQFPFMVHTKRLDNMISVNIALKRFVLLMGNNRVI
jgi:hypothetical protein